MKHRKISFWIVISLGVLGIIASINLYLKDADFSSYFLSGFSGLAIIITMLIDKNKHSIGEFGHDFQKKKSVTTKSHRR